MNDQILPQRFQKWPWILYGVVFLIHLGYVLRFTVNMPTLDEWFFVDQWANGVHFSKDFILAQHNDSRAIPTHVLAWLSYYLTGWSVYPDMLLNFTLLACLAFAFFKINQHLKVISSGLLILFMSFTLSPLSSQIHYYRVCSMWRFFELFSVLAAYLLFKKSARPLRDQALGTICMMLALYSFIDGLASSLILLIFKSAEVIIRRAQTPQESQAKKWWWMMAIIYLASLAYFFVGFNFSDHERMFPWELAYWEYFINLVSMGFSGAEEVSNLIGLIDVILVVTPLLYFLKKKQFQSEHAWVLTAIALSMFAAMGLISIGRGTEGPEFAKIYRYAEVGMLLIPVAAMSWAWILRDHPIWKKRAVWALYAYIFVGFVNDWDFYVYQHLYNKIYRGAACVKEYYRSGGDGFCREVEPRPVKDRLEVAKKLNLSFYRDIAEQLEKEKP